MRYIKWPAGYGGEKIEIKSEWKVLDIGSGHNPFKRADVCLEKDLGESADRSGVAAVIPEEKPLVIGNATNMPFKDKVFDYVVALHIAEHIEDIDKFISELQRVAKKGYIETPGVISDFFLNESFHLWMVSKKNGVLIFRKKKFFKPLSNIFYNFFYLNKNRYGHQTTFSKNHLLKLLNMILIKVWKHIPFTYTKYHWTEKIKYRIVS